MSDLMAALARKGFSQPAIVGCSVSNMAMAECQGRRDKMEDVTFINDYNYANRIVRVAGLFDGHNCGRDEGAASALANVFVEEQAHELIDEMQQGGAKLFFEKLQKHISDRCSFGTTALVSIVYADKTAQIINIGDSRCIALYKDGSVRQITVDHVAKNEKEAAAVVENGGFVLNNRVDGISLITRSLGDKHLHVLHTPEVFDVDLDDVSWLIMACDGVFDVLSNEDVRDCCAEECCTPRDAALSIINTAYKHKAHDNLSVVCIKVD
jgi:serine/threonine protein phosphatase PrpC